MWVVGLVESKLLENAVRMEVSTSLNQLGQQKILLAQPNVDTRIALSLCLAKAQRSSRDCRGYGPRNTSAVVVECPGRGKSANIRRGVTLSRLDLGASGLCTPIQASATQAGNVRLVPANITFSWMRSEWSLFD